MLLLVRFICVLRITVVNSIDNAAVLMVENTRVGVVDNVGVFNFLSHGVLACHLCVRVCARACGWEQAQGFKVESCIVYQRHTDHEVAMMDGRDVWWHDAMATASPECAVEWMDSEDPLFMLYTSG